MKFMMERAYREALSAEYHRGRDDQRAEDLQLAFDRCVECKAKGG